MGLMQRIGLRELRMGEPLFFQGDSPDAYWVILSGALALFMFQVSCFGFIIDFC